MKGKIKNLLAVWPNEAVAVSSWLVANGITAQLCQKYSKGTWLKSLGYGAYSKLSDIPSLLGGIYALQTQLKLKLHIGGLSAIEILGAAHFVPLGEREVQLYSHAKERQLNIPKWFKKNYPNYRKFDRRLFNSELGIQQYDAGNFTIGVSTLERALFEVLSLVPYNMSFGHASQLFAGKETLHLNLVQSLLENCRSQVLMRLFLYFVKAHKLPVFERINFTKFDLGVKQKRVGRGIYYVPEFNLLLPELIKDEAPEV